MKIWFQCCWNKRGRKRGNGVIISFSKFFEKLIMHGTFLLFALSYSYFDEDLGESFDKVFRTKENQNYVLKFYNKLIHWITLFFSWSYRSMKTKNWEMGGGEKWPQSGPEMGFKGSWSVCFFNCLINIQLH